MYLQYHHNTIIPSYIDILIIIIVMYLQEIKINTKDKIGILFSSVMIINLVHSSFVLPIYSYFYNYYCMVMRRNYFQYCMYRMVNTNYIQLSLLLFDIKSRNRPVSSVSIDGAVKMVLMYVPSQTQVLIIVEFVQSLKLQVIPT